MHRSVEGNSRSDGFLAVEGNKTAAGKPALLDTMAAISTPAGEGAIALVRVSGANAIDMIEDRPRHPFELVRKADAGEDDVREEARERARCAEDGVAKRAHRRGSYHAMP